MKQRLLLSYEFKSNKWEIIRILLLTVALLVMGTVYYRGIVKTASGYDLSVFDIWLYLTAGIKPIAEGDKVQIPIIYVGMAALCSYAAGFIMSKDRDYNIVVRNESKMDWIAGKILFVTIIIILMYLCLFGIAVVFGNKDIVIFEDAAKRFLKCDYCRLDTNNILWVVTVLLLIPMLTSIAIAQIQMLISMCAGGMMGFITSLIIYILSVFDSSIMLPGNGCMTQRSLFFTDGGYNILTCVIVDLAVIVTAVTAQILLAKRKEFLG